MVKVTRAADYPILERALVDGMDPAERPLEETFR